MGAYTYVSEEEAVGCDEVYAEGEELGPSIVPDTHPTRPLGLVVWDTKQYFPRISHLRSPFLLDPDESPPMDVDPPLPPSSAPKKPKFTPKAPPRRKTGLVLPKNEGNDDDGEATQALIRKARQKQQKELSLSLELLHMQERLGTRGSKVKKKSSGNVENSHGAGSSSSSSMRTRSQSKAGNSKKNDNSTATKDGDIDEMLIDRGFESSSKTKNEYKEPWDYHSYYPVTLPWRPPYAGNPELLDKEEFGEEKEHDEKNINSASELGLEEKNNEEQMIFFQFPPSLPLVRIPVNSIGKEKVESSTSLKEDSSNRNSSFKDLPNGFMGKMLVYKSGAIKFKLGDNIFDVLPGTSPACAQDVAIMNTKSKECCMLGQLNKKAVVTPDVDSVV